MCDLNDNPLKLSVKWNGKEFEIPEFSPSDSVAMLKMAIENATGVRPERQKLLNVKFQGKLLLCLPRAIEALSKVNVYPQEHGVCIYSIGFSKTALPILMNRREKSSTLLGLISGNVCFSPKYILLFKLYKLFYLGKVATDNYTLSELNLKPNLKIMMMGSLEEAIEGARTKPTVDDVVNDLDIEEEEVDVENQEIYLAKINKRVKDYKINMLNEPREGKKLLVLDIDYTLFDHRSVAESGYELMRPFLHEFLTSAYEEYDIVIWSATGMKWIEEKMRLLGVSTHQEYKIMFYLDYLAMITVHTSKYGTIDVKPLGVIWGKYPQYSSKNTIMFDDIRRNFIMNPKSGLKIRPFRQAHLNRDRDRELLHLSTYLRDIAQYCDDFDTLNHKKWEKYKPEKRQQAGNKRKAEDTPSAPSTPKE